MRRPPAARAGFALALALAASSVAVASVALWPGRGEPAAVQAAIAGLAAVGGAVCLGQRALRALGAVLLAVAALTLARLAGGEPWRALLQGAGVLIIAAGIISLRRSR